jgi:hypothetical protein
MKLKSSLTASAAILLLTAAGAEAAVTDKTATTTQATQATPAPQVQLAQNGAPASSDPALEARIDALEEELQAAEMRAAKAENTAPNPLSGWWSNTSISGRMYWDVSGIENKANGVKVPGGGNGTNFDIKRLYIGIDHTFNDMFSANVTTDTTYDSATGAGQIYLKKAYLQAKIDPALIIRVGSADLPWVPYVEGLYGYRYLENVMIDHTKFGTSADWGVHALGSFFNGIVSYDVAAINGGGYKKIPTGGGTNRFDQFDFEGRVSAAYDGFNLAVGGYTGKLGTPYGTTTYHTAERFDVLGAYVADGLRVGLEYFNANDYSAALVASNTPGDSAHGVSAFGSYYFLPQWGAFARYDTVDTNTHTAPGKNDEYYTVGLTWSPTKIVDFSLAYKHEAVVGGSFASSNGTIGSTTGAMRGTYNEIGLFGDFQW